MSDRQVQAIRTALEYRPLEGQQLRVKADEALDALEAECERLRADFKRQLRLGTEDVRRERDDALAECERLRADLAKEKELRQHDFEHANYIAGCAEDNSARQRAEREHLRAALKRLAEQQLRTLEMLRNRGIVFDAPLGSDPDNWQHVAFWIYNDLCEVDTIARAARSGRQAMSDQYERLKEAYDNCVEGRVALYDECERLRADCDNWQTAYVVERRDGQAERERLRGVLERLTEKTLAYKGGYDPLGAFQLHAAINAARAMLAEVARPGCRGECGEPECVEGFALKDADDE